MRKQHNQSSRSPHKQLNDRDVLAALLNQAGPTSDAKYVVFHSADGYTVGIPLDRATRPEALLAYKMNDEPLPNEHGFPLRAIVPGIYGMMNAKWITEIEVVDYAYLGYWQDRGWSNDARINTTSLIYYPHPSRSERPIPIAGIASAGDRGISKVEVSVDGGRTCESRHTKDAAFTVLMGTLGLRVDTDKQGQHDNNNQGL